MQEIVNMEKVLSPLECPTFKGIVSQGVLEFLKFELNLLRKNLNVQTDSYKKFSI
jgi:hypothetical protein